MKNLFAAIIALLLFNNSIKAEDSAHVYYYKGIEEKTAKRWMMAAKNFEAAIKFNPGFTDAHLELGNTNLEMRKVNQAIQNFERVIQLDANNKTAIAHLASLYFDYRQYQKAIGFAQKCGACENAERIIAMSHFYLEDYVKAEPLLESLLKKNINDALANNIMAQCYQNLDKYDKAIPIYQKAIELDNTKTAWVVDLGDFLYDLKRFKDAVVYYEKAVSAPGYTPSNDFLENMAFTYIYTNQVVKAEATFDKVIAKTGLKDDLAWDIEDAYYQVKLYDNALMYLQKMLEKDPKNAKALYQAGLCFQKKGQTDKGKAMCDKAIEMDPNLAGLRRRESISAGL